MAVSPSSTDHGVSMIQNVHSLTRYCERCSWGREFVFFNLNQPVNCTYPIDHIDHIDNIDFVDDTYHIDHIDRTDSEFFVMICCAGSVKSRSNPKDHVAT